MTPDEKNTLDESSSEFIAEIKEDLVSLEPDLLAMEEKGDRVDDDLINHAFRSIHSIKGGAGFINFTALSSLSHAMENVLMQVREKKLIITSGIVDALLAGFDRMKFLVEQMGKSTHYDGKNEEAALLKVLEPPQKTKVKKEATEQSPSVGEDAIEILQPVCGGQWFKDQEFPVNKHLFEKARKNQKFVYVIHIQLKQDEQTRDIQVQESKVKAIFEDIKSIGEILYSDFDPVNIKIENLDPLVTDSFCVITTILDLPLLTQVLEIDKTQVALVGQKMDNGKIDPDGINISMAGFDESYETSNIVTPDLLIESERKSQLNRKLKPDLTPSTSHLPPVSTDQTIRINVDLVTRLMKRAGELVLSRNQLRPLMETLGPERRQTLGLMQNLDMVTSDIQETIMQMRMQPIGDLVGKYKRVVRDIARRMSKKVEFTLEGAQVEVDRNVLEKLANPLTHLIRNCIDHGIESPDQRRLKDKPETGSIHIKIYHQGGHVHINISDDGAGIDPQLVLSKAFEKELVSQNQVDTLTEKQKMDLIFLPGFSTCEEISDISGRGVGMDVVKTNIERLRGQIEVESMKDQGTIIHLVIPLTLAIVPSLIVGTGGIGSGGARFAVPRVNIKEVIYLEPGQIQKQVQNIAGSEIIRLRDELLPVLRLRNVLNIQTYIRTPESEKDLEEKRKAIADRRGDKKNTSSEDKRLAKNDRRKRQWDATYVMILKLGSNRFGLCVDELYDIEEVVVEPLNQYIKHLRYYTGASILGDGSVIMMLDVPGIAATSALNFDAVLPSENQSSKNQSKDEGQLKNLIIFGNNSKEFFALELSSIARLEPIARSDIHTSGGLSFYEYNGQAMQLFLLDEFLKVTVSDPGDELFLIIPKHVKANVGIIASVIVDTIETEESLSTDVTCSEIVKGKLFVNDQMVQVLNQDLFYDQIEKRAVQIKDKS